jgi:hypothetical protein
MKSSNKFIAINHPSSLFEKQKVNKNGLIDDDVNNNKDLGSFKTIKRRELVCSEKAFLLQNVLSKEECDFYIAETEKKGFEDLGQVFPEDYRNNGRLLTLANDAATALFQRILPYLKETGYIFSFKKKKENF